RHRRPPRSRGHEMPIRGGAPGPLQYPPGVMTRSNVTGRSRGRTGMKPGYTDHKDEVRRRLRRIEGQVRGLQRMVDEDTYCIDVLTQISAATRALQSVALELLGDHLSHCVQDAL